MSKLKKTKNNQFIFMLLMIVVFIRSALRSFAVGNDTETYLHIFSAVNSTGALKDVITSGLIYTIEIGYLFLNWFCSEIFNHYQSILILSSVLIFIGYYKFLRKYSYSLLLAFATFFFLRFSDEAMNIIRQSIAMVILLNSYDYIEKNQKRNFIVAVLIAMLFHTTAIVFLPAWWICKMNLNRKMIFRFLSMSIVLMIMLKLGTVILFSFMGRYANYMSDAYEYSSGGKIAPLINVLMYTIILFFVSYQIKKSRENSDLMMSMIKMRNLLFTGICILIISLSNALVFRVAIYYYIFVIALLPNAVKLSKNKAFWTLIISISLLAYYLVIIIYRPDWNLVYPYSFFWEQPFLP